MLSVPFAQKRKKERNRVKGFCLLGSFCNLTELLILIPFRLKIIEASCSYSCRFEFSATYTFFFRPGQDSLAMEVFIPNGTFLVNLIFHNEKKWSIFNDAV